jgi:hypothetical protein
MVRAKSLTWDISAEIERSIKMLKKLGVPFLVLSLTALACSSSNNGGAGGAGGSGAKGGSGGSGTGGSGTGGSGTGGSGTGGAGGASTDGSVDAVSDGSGDATLADLAAAMCPSKTNMNTAVPFSAEQFCALYAATCSTIVPSSALLNASTCMSTYATWTSTSVDGGTGQQGCRSDHLCNAVRGNPQVHCWHAEGMANPGDGGVNPCP